MSTPALKTYQVFEMNNPSQAREVKAERAQKDNSSGRIEFYIGDEIVASFVNVNFTKVG